VARPKAHPLFSRLHPVLTSMRERRGDADNRADLVAGLGGRVIEIGCGIGANFRYYPESVEKVLAIEPQPWLRRHAVEAAAAAKAPIEVVDGDAEAIEAADGSFDAAVVSLVLCSVPDPAATIGELVRVVRPGGELRFFEHVVAEHRGRRGLQKIADATLWPHMTGGCHLARDTKADIEAAGFEVADYRRFPLRLMALTPPDPHLLGTARRP
jgi:ubiquinone/menaquinone biosynthesis C-methylase UbiE